MRVDVLVVGSEVCVGCENRWCREKALKVDIGVKGIVRIKNFELSFPMKAYTTLKRQHK